MQKLNVFLIALFATAALAAGPLPQRSVDPTMQARRDFESRVAGTKWTGDKPGVIWTLNVDGTASSTDAQKAKWAAIDATTILVQTDAGLVVEWKFDDGLTTVNELKGKLGDKSIAKRVGNSGDQKSDWAGPTIAGHWQEKEGVILTITQTAGKWSATCSYTTPTDGDVAWEINDATVTPDGKIHGKLHHTKAPANWKPWEVLDGKVSTDGKTISGIATFDYKPHPFAWMKHGDVVSKDDPEIDPSLPPEIRDAMKHQTLMVGMTLAQCNKSLGHDGKVTGATAGIGTSYEWYVPLYGETAELDPASGKVLKLPGKQLQGSTPFTGIIQDGKLVSFEKGRFEPFNSGSFQSR